jgi:hypothetical protein
MSERTRAVLEFMHIAVERYGDAGQPLWPVVSSSLYGAFLAGEATEARILVVTFDASVGGRGGCGAFCTRGDGHGNRRLLSSGRSNAREGVRGSSSAPCVPASQVYRETLAGLFATRAASRPDPQ